MSNWYNTAIAVFGKESDLKRFHSVLEELSGNSSLLPNDFDNMWEGNLLYYAGADYSNESCSGNIVMFHYSKIKNCVYINQNDEWTPNTEYLRTVFAYLNLDLDFVYTTEEPEYEVFINTDASGVFFPARYRLEMDACSYEGYYVKYYTNFEDMIQDVRLRLNNPELNNIREAERYANTLDWIYLFHINTFKEE